MNNTISGQVVNVGLAPGGQSQITLDLLTATDAPLRALSFSFGSNAVVTWDGERVTLQEFFGNLASHKPVYVTTQDRYPPSTKTDFTTTKPGS